MTTMNFEFCRLCLRRKRTSTSTRVVESLQARVLWIFQIKLCEGDGLPTQMCNTCMDRLSIAQQLKETILSVDTTLRLRGSNFHEQDLSMSIDEGVIPLHAVKMEQEAGVEDGKKKRGRKRRKKETTGMTSSTELEAYGLQYTDQLTAPLKESNLSQQELEEPATDFLLKEADIDDINHNESFSFHTVLEIKEENQEISDNETEYPSQVELDAEYVGHLENGTGFPGDLAHGTDLEDANYPTVLIEDDGVAYAGTDSMYRGAGGTFEAHMGAESAYLPDEPELVIDEGPEAEVDTEALIPVPVLSLTEDLLKPQLFGQENDVPMAVAAFRGKEPDLTVPLTMSTFENVELSCSSGTSTQQDGDEENTLGSARNRDVEDALPVTQVFKTLRRKLAKKLNDMESNQDSQNGTMSSDETATNTRLENVAEMSSRILPVKERHRCERCKRWYVNFIKLSQHRCRARPLKTKKTINYVKCSLCEDVFYKLSDLNEHVRSHRHVESHHCTLCDRRFTNKTGLTKHMSLCHKQEAWASQVGIAEGVPTVDTEEAVVIVEEKQSEVSNERSILKALLAGQRVPKVT